METEKKLINCSLELWGGIECTINRIDDAYLDQLQYAKHYAREKDIDAIAELGIKTLRYPILWETHQPVNNKEIDWGWTTKQLDALRNQDITPIAGLLHHGSGPLFTNLLDESFPKLFAAYAKQVALKFPWIKYYTPINEPLTTARFSGLYGFWYPHIKNDISFAKMMLNQLRGVVLAMKEIRSVNPDAELIQTEDLGKTYSSPYLQFQANFENERRWLTFDLLCGRVNREHSMWKYFSRLGIDEDFMQFFLDNPCPPNIMGFNYYVTSERFLDEHLDNYPSYTYGGNELQVYADVEAARVKHDQPHGLDVLLKEAWERYNLPMAITEAHLNCTREEQLRWLYEIWNICSDLNKKGIGIKAVTSWSLLGAFGWNELLTSPKMEYEIGAFDLRSGTLRPTAVAALVKSLAENRSCDHPLLKQKGWWKRDIRFYTKSSIKLKTLSDGNILNPLIIIGKRGTLGKAFSRICTFRGIDHLLLGRDDLDITNEKRVEEVMIKYKPWAIINAAGFVRVDDAENHIEKCFNDNAKGPFVLATACKKYGAQFMTFSSDLVFDGTKKQPYLESDKINPLSIYGKSKAESESTVIGANANSLIIRTSSFFGPWDEYNFVHHVLHALSQNKIFTAANDVIISPTYVPDLVNVSLDLLIDNEKGIWHLTNKGETSWADLAINISERAGLECSLIESTSAQSLNLRAPRPQYSVLKTEKGILLPSLDNALNRYLQERIIIPPQTEMIKN